MLAICHAFCIVWYQYEDEISHTGIKKLIERKMSLPLKEIIDILLSPLFLELTCDTL